MVELPLLNFSIPLIWAQEGCVSFVILTMNRLSIFFIFASKHKFFGLSSSFYFLSKYNFLMDLSWADGLLNSIILYGWNLSLLYLPGFFGMLGVMPSSEMLNLTSTLLLIKPFPELKIFIVLVLHLARSWSLVTFTILMVHSSSLPQYGIASIRFAKVAFSFPLLICPFRLQAAMFLLLMLILMLNWVPWLLLFNLLSIIIWEFRSSSSVTPTFWAYLSLRIMLAPDVFSPWSMTSIAFWLLRDLHVYASFLELGWRLSLSLLHLAIASTSYPYFILGMTFLIGLWNLSWKLALSSSF